MQARKEAEVPGARRGVKHGVGGRQVDRQGRPGRLEHPGNRSGSDHDGAAAAPGPAVYGAGGVAQHRLRAPGGVAADGEIAAPETVDHLLRRLRRGPGPAIGMRQGVAQQEPVAEAGDRRRGSGIRRQPERVVQNREGVAALDRPPAKPLERIGGVRLRRAGGDEREPQHQTTRIGEVPAADPRVLFAWMVGRCGDAALSRAFQTVELHLGRLGQAERRILGNPAAAVAGMRAALVEGRRQDAADRIAAYHRERVTAAAALVFEAARPPPLVPPE